VKLIIVLILIYLAYRLTKSVYPQVKKGYREGMAKSDETILDEMVKDPVCQVYLPRKQAISEKMGNERYFFCSEECRRKYKENVKG